MCAQFIYLVVLDSMIVQCLLQAFDLLLIYNYTTETFLLVPLRIILHYATLKTCVYIIRLVPVGRFEIIQTNKILMHCVCTCYCNQDLKTLRKPFVCIILSYLIGNAI
jgi:hypothetical protein